MLELAAKQGSNDLQNNLSIEGISIFYSQSSGKSIKINRVSRDFGVGLLGLGDELFALE